MRAYMPLYIGAARFEFADMCMLVVSLSVTLVSAFGLWRIAQREDRVDRLGRLNAAPFHRTEPAGRRLTWYDRLGRAIASSPIVGTAKQKKLLSILAAAGIRGRNLLPRVIACQLGCGAALAGLWMIVKQLLWGESRPQALTLVGAAAFVCGWGLPLFALSRLAARRRARVESGIPDALDLLVICTESGLGLDQAIAQVTHEIRPSNRQIAEELAETAAEMRILQDRAQALENLSRRTEVSSLRSIVATLNQSIKFGTPLAVSLRVLAEEMRRLHVGRLEERAARLPSLLSIPLMLFILPALIIVLAAPLVLRIVDMFGAMSSRIP